jgi:hypothetical protein
MRSTFVAGTARRRCAVADETARPAKGAGMAGAFATRTIQLPTGIKRRIRSLPVEGGEKGARELAGRRMRCRGLRP